MGGKVCCRCNRKILLGNVNKLLKPKSLLTSPSNVLPYLPWVNFPANNLNFPWRWMWWDPIQATFLNLFYFTFQRPCPAMAASFFQFRLKANTTLPSAGKYSTFIQSQNKCLWEIFVIHFSNMQLCKMFWWSRWRLLFFTLVWFSIIKLK